MTGNAADQFATRYDGWQVTAAGDQPCEQCGGHLPDHEWFYLADDGHEGTIVVDCSGEVR